MSLLFSEKTEVYSRDMGQHEQMMDAQLPLTKFSLFLIGAQTLLMNEDNRKEKAVENAMTAIEIDCNSL